MILCYGRMEILASLTEDEVVESFLSIVRCRLKYFNLTGIGVYDFRCKIFDLKDGNPQWNPALRIIEICMCAPISNTFLERLFNQMVIIKIKCAKSLDKFSIKYTSTHQSFESSRRFFK